MQGQDTNWIAYGIGLVIAVAIIAFRSHRMSKPRELSFGRLLLVPLLILAITASTLAQHPPAGLDVVWLGLAFVAGAAVGWQRGRLMKIWIDADTGKTMIQGSVWAIVFLVALVAMRMALRAGLAYEAEAGAFDPALVSSLFMVFALGLFGTQQAEMGLRAKRLRETA